MKAEENHAEIAERDHLEQIVELLRQEKDAVGRAVDKTVDDVAARKQHLWDNVRDMDFAEKADYRSSVDISVLLGEQAMRRRERLARLLDCPYFGRVDFRARDEAQEQVDYIGVHNFFHPDTRDILIHDWRAPVSSLFYDYEIGPAHFEAPAGTVDGDLTGKRQFRIRDGQLDYMLASSLTIRDDVLQRELSQSADAKMRTIIATIQREQNAIIRNETAEVLILQGVAGSGKTSIALHRVAFLLYRFKDTLASQDVMILSPNKVFGDYIAGVLPELGEEQIPEIDFDAIAARFLSRLTDYETFNEQVACLLDGTDDATIERIRYKATPEFIDELDDWIAYCTRHKFEAGEISQKYKRLSADWVERVYRDSADLPVFARLGRIAAIAAQRLKNETVDGGGKWTGADTSAVVRQVRAMFPYKNAMAIYKDFFTGSRRHLFRQAGRKKIEYADVFPLIHTIITTERPDISYGHIRHLVIDEMQDYTPAQYAVIRALFSCKMTILGDANQSVNPFSSTSLPVIRRMFPDADCLELRTSYRSSTEITEFAQNISPNEALDPIERHGEDVQVVHCGDDGEQIQHIRALLHHHQGSQHRTLGIICKTVEHAAHLHDALAAAGGQATLLDYSSTHFADGVVITSAHIAKGLEFDTVIVPDTDDRLYRTDIDKSMLYIACTRALHELHCTFTGELSAFLNFAVPAVRDAEHAATSSGQGGRL